MSELKVYKPYANRDGDMFLYHKGDEDLMLDDEDEIYLKSEADKVIAEKDAKILARACVPFSQIIEVKYGEKT